MAAKLTRSILQQLAEKRLIEARVLLDASQYEGAYYLAGYAVECALKACIAKQTRRYDFPPDRSFTQDVYTHSMLKLVKAASLETDLDRTSAASPDFQLNWRVVQDWSEEKRYQLSISEREARDLYAAITHRKNGVLRWLKKLW